MNVEKFRDHMQRKLENSDAMIGSWVRAGYLAAIEDAVKYLEGNAEPRCEYRSEMEYVLAQ